MSWYRKFLSTVKEVSQEAFRIPNQMDVWTPRARRAFDLAREEVERSNGCCMGTEHLLLGLLRLDSGVAVQLLFFIGVDVDGLRKMVTDAILSRQSEPDGATAGCSAEVNEVLKLAQREAKQLGHHYVGSEHLLLELLQDKHGVAAQVFRNANVDVARLRHLILEQISPSSDL